MNSGNQLFFNNNHGSFDANNLFEEFQNGQTVLTADVNNDGFEDIIVGNWNDGESSILFLNKGKGAFLTGPPLFIFLRNQGHSV